MAIKRDARDTRQKYLDGSVRLRELSAPFALNDDALYKRIRQDQKKIYSKWRFYDEIIKQNERIRSEENKEN